METLIAYGTKHGCTENIAEKIAEKLEGKVDLYNLNQEKEVDISSYDNIIIGGSIYAGKIRGEVKEFYTKNIEVLKDKKIGLFISCMWEGEKAEEQLEVNFPDELYEKAAAKKVLGGEFDFNKLNFFERMIVKIVSGVKESQSNILEENIDEFCTEVLEGGNR